MTRKKNKPASLVALAHTLDTRKRTPPAPVKEAKPAQKQLIEAALRSKGTSPAPVAAKVVAKVEAKLASRAPAPVVAKVEAKPVVAKPVVAAKPAPARVTSLPPRAPSRDIPPPPRAVNLPTRPTVASAPPPAPVANRAAALTSLARAPSPAPARMPVAKPASTPTAAVQSDPRRQYPRAPIQVRASLSLADDPSRTFDASLPTVNLSVGGMFLESSFFLKLGTKLLIQLELPNRGRPVKVKGEVVRVQDSDSGSAGFALRFTEYLDGSQVILATHFLSPVLREFLQDYAKEHRFEASAEYLAHTADVLAAWELKKAELGGDVWDLFSSKRA